MPPRPTPTINNRRARHDYLVLDTLRVRDHARRRRGEVDPRRARPPSRDAYARVENGEVFLHGMHVTPYFFSSDDLDPLRPRKLLLHHRQIDELHRATLEKGVTLVPLKLLLQGRPGQGRARDRPRQARLRQAPDHRRARRQARGRAGHEGRPRAGLRMPGRTVPSRRYTGRCRVTRTTRHLTWGCVASISWIEAGEASRRRRIVVKEPAPNTTAEDNDLALAA